MLYFFFVQEMARLPFRGDEKASQFSDPYDGPITPLTAKFVARKKWIIVGCSSGYIKVYSYCKQSLFSEIESFKAHNTTTKQAFVPGHLSRQPLGPGQ